MAQAIAAGNEAASIASARRAVEDDIDDRNFAYGGAVQHLLRIAIANGTIAEEIAWLDEVAPGILDIDAVSATHKFRTAQVVAIEAWYSTLPHEELVHRIETLQQAAAGSGADPFSGPGLQMAVLAMRGETNDAIEFGLNNLFSESVLAHLTWEEALGLPQYKELGQDDRIKAATERWQDEQTVQSDAVRDYLAKLSAGL
jgi:hypothetical protein